METRETITLDARAQQRLLVLTHVLAGELDVGEAAAYLRLSPRQVTRLAERLHTEGAAGLVHGNRGRRPANRVDDTIRSSIVDAALTTHAGFNPVHFAEALAETDPTVPSPRTVRRILAAAGVEPPRTRRPPTHRSRRERMAKAGMLLQTDGSKHDWLEGRGPVMTLVAGIDDSTGDLTGGTFRTAEDAAGYFEMLHQTVRRHGLPLALYSDLSGVFIKDPNRPPTLAEQLTGRRSLTQVGRALDALGVHWIGARSAEAKGRAERLWGTLQDRLVSELRRAAVATLEDANELFAWYLPRHNRRFGVEAADPEPAWRPWPSDLPPEAVLCFEYPRRVGRDATIGWDGGSLALPRRRGGAGWAGRRVVVQERLDGSLWARDDRDLYPLVAAPPTAPVLRARRLNRVPELSPPPEPREPVTDPAPSAASTPRQPSDHPWRRYPAVRPR
ncbi:MAG TPA: ISNCY family transposase [Patescibacteria group bacterium]|nr:ISNCY family transposase [Patescibacteria group bacterium]